MLIAIVQIPLAGEKPKEQAIMGGMKSTDQYLGMPGLIRKDYLSSDEGAGGVYLWETREAAEAWYNDDWWVMMQDRYGVRPSLTLYDHYLTVDNDAGVVTVDRVPVEKESAAAAK
jgi:hypothetical protein